MKKVLEYLLYLFIFLLPWQTRWIISDPHINGNVWEYGRISLYSFDVVFIILLILFLALSLSRRLILNFRNISKSVIPCLPVPHLRWTRDPENKLDFVLQRNDKKVKLILLAIIFIVLNFIVADNKLLSFYWFLRIIQGALLILILYKINFSKIKLVWAFIISMFLSASLGIYQFLSQSAFASKWLGLASHSASILGDSVVEIAGERWLRAYGSFPHPNILAGFIIVALILIFQFLISNIKTLRYKLLYYFITLLLTIALFFTFSRSAWIVFMLIIIYQSIVAFKKNRKLLLHYFITLLLLLLLVLIYFPLVKTRIIGTERLEVKSNIERMSGYSQAFQIIKKHSLLGVGIGNYTVELQKIYPDQSAWDYQPVHNVYLLVLAEAGAIGVIFIITLLLYYFITYYKRYKIVDKNFIFLYFYIFIFLFFFDHFWWTLPSGMLLFFLIVGFLKKIILNPNKP